MSIITEQIDEAYRALSPVELEAFLKDLCKKEILEHGRVSAEYVTACNELGTFFRGRARYDEGESAYQEALACAEALVGRTDPYATCLDNLGELYRLQGKLDLCEEYLLKAERAFSNKESVEYAACLNYQGHLAGSRHDHKRARDCYLRSLAIVEPNCSDSLTLATGYQNAASAFQAVGDLQSAASYLEKSIDIYRRGSLSPNAHYVGLLNQIATLKMAQGQDDEAASTFDIALDTVNAVAISPLDAAIVLVNAAALYKRHGDADKFDAVLPHIEELMALDSIKGNPLMERIKKLIDTWR